MTTIELGNIGCEDQAKRLQGKLTGKTYMNFIVDFANATGNFPVSVSTDYPNVTEEELRQMVLFEMATVL